MDHQHSTAMPAAEINRCPAAHRDDATPCEGPHNAVRILDQRGTERLGCVHHAARLLASIEGGRVYPGPSSTVGRTEGNGAAIDAYKRAQHLPPFCWRQNGGTR
jgi:hypothetical protein